MPEDLPSLPPEWLSEAVPNDEAVAFVQSKVPVSSEVFKKLLPELKARAFAVAGVTSAAVARDIRDAVAKVPAGADWDTQKKHIAALLEPYLGGEDDEPAKGRAKREARAELILRTHGFQAYAVAQHETLREQQDIFPFWQYLSQEDENVRQTHAKLNKLIVRADSPFWHRHSPPWDWGCRCRKVPLMEDEVDEIKAREDAAKVAPEKRTVIEGAALESLERNKLNRGLTEVYDLTPSGEKGKAGGFVFEPDSLRLSLAELQPRYDAETWREFLAWSRQTPLDADGGPSLLDWLQGRSLQASAKKATAGAGVGAVAAAKKTVQRTLDGIEQELLKHQESWQRLVDAEKEIQALQAQARATKTTQLILQAVTELNEAQHALEKEREKLRAIVSIPKKQRGKLVIQDAVPKELKQSVKTAAELLQGYTHPQLLPKIRVELMTGKRAEYRGDSILIGPQTNISIILHEMTHGTEMQTASVLQKSLDFLAKRAGGQQLRMLRDLTGNPDYTDLEWAWEDQWVAKGGEVYTGKTYSGMATEILTTGIERLHRDPLQFLLTDPEFFRFVMSTLQQL